MVIAVFPQPDGRARYLIRSEDEPSIELRSPQSEGRYVVIKLLPQPKGAPNYINCAGFRVGDDAAPLAGPKAPTCRHTTR